MATHRSLLRKDLKNLGEEDADIIEAGSHEEFLEQLKTREPHIVFMDIDLGNAHAFKILDKVEDRRFELIFTTAHGEYAIDSYKYDATDYLTKPLNRDRLNFALEKAKNAVREKIKNWRNETLLFNISDFPKFEKRIQLKEAGRVVNKRLNEIMYIKSDNSDSIFHFGDETVVRVSRNLKHYEDELAEYHFFRTHNSFLVNLFFVEAYIYSTEVLVLTNKKILSVSRRRKDFFLEALAKISIR